MTDTATQETGAVDAPASMDSVLAEFTQDPTPKEDATDEVVRELVNEAEEGHAEEAPDEGEATDADEDGEADKAPEAETEEAAASDLDMNRIVTVKVDGQDVQVPLSEALKGYSREADYTKKAMALADERKTLESTVTAKYANDLKQATELFVKTDPILAEASSIDWNALAQEDPATYTQLRAAVDQRMQVIGQAQQEIQRVAQEQEQQTANERVEGMKAAEARIRESDPTLADDAKFSAYIESGVQALLGVGLDTDALQDVLSNPDIAPKVLSLVDKAQKWDAQEKARAALPGLKVVPAPSKTLRSDASDTSKPTRRAPPSASSRDDKVSWAVRELLDSGT